jgi:hypothetical protein
LTKQNETKFRCFLFPETSRNFAKKFFCFALFCVSGNKKRMRNGNPSSDSDTFLSLKTYSKGIDSRKFDLLLVAPLDSLKVSIDFCLLFFLETIFDFLSNFLNIRCDAVNFCQVQKLLTNPVNRVVLSSHRNSFHHYRSKGLNKTKQNR